MVDELERKGDIGMTSGEDIFISVDCDRFVVIFFENAKLSNSSDS